MQDWIVYEVENHVATVTINRPEKRNAMTYSMLAGSPFSHTRIKRLVYEGLGGDVSLHMKRHTEALAECFKSEDHIEGVASFLERRPAKFTGR